MAPYYLQDENLTFQLAGTGGVSLRPHPSFLCTKLTKAGHHHLSNVPPAVHSHGETMANVVEVTVSVALTLAQVSI